jgi:hypothetical protein
LFAFQTQSEEIDMRRKELRTAAKRRRKAYNHNKPKKKR